MNFEEVRNQTNKRMALTEWKYKLLNNSDSSASYRIGNCTVHFQYKVIIFFGAIAFLGILYLSLPLESSASSNYGTVKSIPVGGKKGSILWASNNVEGHELEHSSPSNQVDKKYPFTEPVQTEKGLRYQIGIISDLDQDSKSPGGKWISYLRKGSIYVQYKAEDVAKSVVSIEWENGEPVAVKSGLNQDGRGMELSELVAFNGKLYSCDDRTGIVFELHSPNDDDVSPIPWVILADGNGTQSKGFKCEWATVKGNSLWIGGLGKEWTTQDGILINHNPQFVKSISSTGEVQHYDWNRNYKKLAQALDINFPGYVIHESGSWSEIHQKWVFLPRRASHDQYNDKIDEKKGTNVMLLADEKFNHVEVRHVGDVIPSHGFSSFKWIPNTDDRLIVALKSEEVEGKTASYVMVFDVSGNILFPETKVGDHKYEGIEFL